MEQVTRSKTMLLYVGIFSIVMLFAGLTSAYVVSMGGGYWVDINLPNAFYYSTISILVSSIVYWWAMKKLRLGNVKLYRHGLIITFILGLAFYFFSISSMGRPC